MFAGRIDAVDVEFWDSTGATSFNIAAGNMIVAGAVKDGSFTHYGMNKLLDHVAGGDSLGLAGPWYLGLSTTAIAADGTGITEPSGGNYSRVSVALSSSNWKKLGTGPGNTWCNKVDISFPAPSGAWNECLYLFASDASSAGNIVWKAPLNRPITVASGDTAPIIYAEALQIQI